MDGRGGLLQGGRRRPVVAGALFTALLLAAGCGGGSGGPNTADSTTFVAAPTGISPAGAWAFPNGNLANTRNVGGPVSSSTVTRLGVAWTVPIKATGASGGYASTPIIVDGTVYAQDLDSNVQAIDLKTGAVKWEKRFDSPSAGPNGVAVGDGRVYGGTGDGAFALDQATGRELWSLRLTRNDREGVDMAPGYKDGIVYLSTVPGNASGFYRGDGVGILYALNARTGRRIWSFKTVPEDLWDPAHKDINSGGGLLHPPAFDSEGDIYVDVANPAPRPGTERFPWGQSRPGDNLFTNSLVKLDATSGEVKWHHQVLPHDLYGWALHLPPVLTAEHGINTVISAGRQGEVYAFNAENGDLLWNRSVGIHNGHDGDNQLALSGSFDQLSTPVTVYPGTFGGVASQMAAQKGVLYVPVVDLPTTFATQESSRSDPALGRGQMVALAIDTGNVEWTQRFPAPIFGAATVVNDLLFTTTVDGTLYALDVVSGKVLWSERLPAGTDATVAVAGDTLVTAAGNPQGSGQRAEIVAYRIGARARRAAAERLAQAGRRAQTQPSVRRQAQAGTGAAALAAGRTAFTTNCASCHTLAAANASGTVGPNLDTVRPGAAAVAAKVTSGGGGMPAFGGRLTRAEIASISAYVASVAGR